MSVSPTRPVSAVIPAGGVGVRMGGDRPKQWLDLAGISILERSIRIFDVCAQVGEIVVALPPGSLALELRGTLQTPLHVVEGGATRQDSVARGFAATAEQAEFVVVHDAARPLCPVSLVERTLEAAAVHGAAIAALAAHDTVKQRAAGDPGVIGRTLAREMLALAQTPQAFRREVLADAIRLSPAGSSATDEATLAEWAGYRVALVDGVPNNIKITTPGDLEFARRLLGDSMTMPRVGIGYDLHRLVEGRPLILGGVEIPFERGLVGHSDADVVCHAVTDALLGAAAAGDIGRHFPDTDPRWKGASSIELLRAVAALVRECGFEIGNVDVVVVAERPKIGPYAEEMVASVADAVGVAPSLVSIKGKTNEGVDATGRGEAIATHAVAMLREAPRP